MKSSQQEKSYGKIRNMRFYHSVLLLSTCLALSKPCRGSGLQEPAANHTKQRSSGVFSVRDLMSFFAENPAAGLSLESAVRCLLEKRSEFFRGNSVFLYRSDSIQDASFVNPRVILFDNLANMTLTFNGHPQQTGYKKLEIRDFDRDRNKVSFYEIEFDELINHRPGIECDDQTVSLPPPDLNKVNCSGCHGMDEIIGPLWDADAISGSAYGGATGIISRFDPKYSKFISFINSNRSRSVYKPVLPFDYLSKEGNIDFRGKPVYRLTNAIAKINFQQMANRILELNNIDLANRLMSVFAGCAEHLTLPEDYKNIIEAELNSYLEYRAPLYTAEDRYPEWNEGLITSGPDLAREIANFKWLMETYGNTSIEMWAPSNMEMLGFVSTGKGMVNFAKLLDDVIFAQEFKDYFVAHYQSWDQSKIWPDYSIRNIQKLCQRLAN